MPIPLRWLFGVTIAALCPGYVETPMTAATIANVVARTGRSEDDARRAVLDSAGQSRMLTAEEVAAAALALCGPDAKNGSIVKLMP